MDWDFNLPADARGMLFKLRQIVPITAPRMEGIMWRVDFQSVRCALRMEHRVMDTHECSDDRRCNRPFTNQVERRQ